MKRLILSEFKKILKNKFYLVLIFILSLSTIGITYYTYNNYARVFDENCYFADFEGQKLTTGIERARFADSYIHKYKGKWSQQILDRMEKDFMALLKQHKREHLDIEKMINAYGEHYQELIDLMNKNELTEKEIQKYEEKYQVDVDYYSKDDNEKYQIDYYYQEDPIRDTIALIYFAPYLGDKNYENEDIRGFWKFIAAEFENADKVISSQYFFGRDISKEKQQAMIDYYISHSKNIPDEFDSTIPNNLLLDALENILVLPLFIVAIILANMFGIERQTKMEDIIFTTATTKKKITLVKMIVGILISLIVVFMQIAICMIASYIFLPVHSWNLMVMPMAGTAIGYVPFTYQTILIQSFLFIVISCISIAIITMLLSYLMPNRFIVVVIMIVFLILSWFGGQLESVPTLFKLFMPYNMSSFLKFFYGYVVVGQWDYPYLFTGTSVIPIKWIMVSVWSLLSILISLFMIKHSKNNLTYR